MLNMAGAEVCDVLLLRAGGPQTRMLESFVWLGETPGEAGQALVLQLCLCGVSSQLASAGCGGRV